MSLRIVDADIVAMRIAKHSKKMSDQLRTVLEVVTHLKHGQTKRIVLEEGETARSARMVLRKASKLSGVDLRIGTSIKGEIVFAITHQEAKNRKRIGTAARKKIIREAARKLARDTESIAIDDVLRALSDAGVLFDDVKRPGTMVGAVVCNMDEFERIGRGVYRRKG